MATRDELRKEAKGLKIPRYSRMNKAELEAAVAAAKAGTVEPLAESKPATAPKPTKKKSAKKEKDRVVIISDDLKLDDSMVHTIGTGTLEEAGVFLLGLKQKSRREARKFRKKLREAGYNAAAGVDTRNYERIAA